MGGCTDGKCVVLITWLWHAVTKEGVHDAGSNISPHTRCLDDQRVFKGQRTQSYRCGGRIRRGLMGGVIIMG